MDVVVVEPRADELVALALLKKHLRLEHDDDDDLVELYAEAVTSWLDGPAGWLNRSLAPQTLRVTLALKAPDADVALPYGVASEVSAVTWLDSDGAGQTVDGADYELVGSSLRLTAGSQWPSADKLTVTYVAGYEAGAAPKAIVAAILLMTGDLYAIRETAVVGSISADIKMTSSAERLLTPYRLWPE